MLLTCATGSTRHERGSPGHGSTSLVLHQQGQSGTVLSRPNSEEARSGFLDRLSSTDQAIGLRTAEISGPGPRDPAWLIAEASAAAADRISEVVGKLSAS